MNIDTTVDLDHLHDVITQQIQAQFPQFRTVEFYREDRKSLPVPACLLELSDWETHVDPDPGTEQQAVMAKFEAEILISFKTPNRKRVIRKLAAAFGAWMHLRRWGPDAITGPAEVIGAFPEDFHPELDQFEVWRVEWQQIIHLGQQNLPGIGPIDWPDNAPVPEIFVGISPDIGIGHEPDYFQIIDLGTNPQVLA